MLLVKLKLQKIFTYVVYETNMFPSLILHIARAHIVLDFQTTSTSWSSPSISHRDVSARIRTNYYTTEKLRKGINFKGMTKK